MPNPKVGTVTMDVTKAIKEAKGGKIEFRAEKAGIVHAPLGKASFATEKLQENFLSLMELVMKMKPAARRRPDGRDRRRDRERLWPRLSRIAHVE